MKKIILFAVALFSLSAYAQESKVDNYTTYNSDNKETGHVAIIQGLENGRTFIQLNNFNFESELLLDNKVYYNPNNSQFIAATQNNIREKYTSKSSIDLGKVTTDFHSLKDNSDKQVVEVWKSDYVYFDILPVFVAKNLNDFLSGKITKLNAYSPEIIVASKNFFKIVPLVVDKVYKDSVDGVELQFVKLKIDSFLAKKLLPEKSLYYIMAFDTKQKNKLYYYELGGYSYKIKK